MTFKVIRGQGQGEEMTSVPYRDYFILAFGSSSIVLCTANIFNHLNRVRRDYHAVVDDGLNAAVEVDAGEQSVTEVVVDGRVGLELGGTQVLTAHR